jgi:site-specific DNA-methyltransferase (adenine-specific)
MTFEKQTIGTATLYNCDNMDYMRSLPDGAFELAIVDPPYGINAPKMAATPNDRRIGRNRLNSGGGKLQNRILNTADVDWDDAIPNDEYFTELFRVSKNQIIWGGNYFNLPPTRGVICWDKVQPWENFSAWEMAWTSFDKPAALFKFDNRTGDKIHPTQKPVSLYEWLLSKYANSGDKILDTHLGSGSIAIACQTLGFELTGCELNESYFESATKRIKAAFQQTTLFEPMQPAQVQESLI